MVDLIFAADPLEDVFEGINVPFAIGERGLIARPHTVDPARHNGDPVAQKRGGGHFPGPSVPFHEGELEVRSIATKTYNLPAAV